MDRLQAWAACALIGVGCGQLGGMNNPGADGTQDAPPDAATLCDPLGTFSAPVPLGGLATNATEAIGSLSPDELTLYPGVSSVPR
jgi:hypothetical protein